MSTDKNITEELRALMTPSTGKPDYVVDSLEELLNVLDVVPRNRRGLPKMHYRRGDTDHAACGRASRVTSDPARVTCQRCRQYLPPTPVEAAELFAKMDELPRGTP